MRLKEALGEVMSPLKGFDLERIAPYLASC
jgi:hypothetical protein